MARRDKAPEGMGRRAREAHAQGQAGLHPEAWRRQLLRDERGTLHKDAPLRFGLCYPNPYRVAMSSLGYQVVYRMINARPGMCCERIVLPDDEAQWRRRRWAPVSIETGRKLAAFDVLAFSVTFDLDISGFFSLLDMAGVPARREAREAHHPPVILGGPVTASNPLPFGPFVDCCVVGDAERALPLLLDAVEAAADRDDLHHRAAQIDGVWVPALDGEELPATQKVTDDLPAFGQIITPHAELSDMFLVEPSRGCPRFCRFCLVRAPESPMRENPVQRVLDTIPDHATRVGLVGAAVSEWEGVREALRACVDRGLGVGISSLRADRLDEELVGLLARGGYRTMTVASDAASQRLRNKMAKGLRTRHLMEAARLARREKMTRLKIYVVIGLPEERDDDIDELIAFTREVAEITPVALGLSPLVPKLHTPLADAPFAGIKAIDRTLRRLRDGLGGVADIRATSARWAWVAYRMSQGGQTAGVAALEAWEAGGRFRDWEKAMAPVPERGALTAATSHGHFDPAPRK